MLCMKYRMTIATHCKNKPALYPIPIPVDEICVERRSSMDVIFFAGSKGRVASGEVDRRAVVTSASACGAGRESSGGSPEMTVDGRSGVASGLWN